MDDENRKPKKPQEPEVLAAVNQAIVPKESTDLMSMASSRAVAEVQGKIAVAKKFPRDESVAYQKIMKACERKSLSEVAVYEYSRGGSKIDGPSIRLAEALAQNWGNIDTGFMELARNENESLVETYCIDLETNYQKRVTFTVPHERRSRERGVTRLTDARDVYENLANMASRRLRNCILAVIPGDIVEAAVHKCEETMKSGHSKSLSDRIRDMVTAFTNDFGISKEQIEKKLNHKIEVTSENELVRLRKIYVALKDGMAGIGDHFEIQTGSAAKEVAQAVGAPGKMGATAPAAEQKQSPLGADTRPQRTSKAESSSPDMFSTQNVSGGKDDPRNVK